MPLLDFWTIKIVVDEQKSSVYTQQMRDELYISPHVRLAGMKKMAHIESEELAQDFLSACRPIFDKRYKSGCYEAWVEACSAGDHKSIRALIAKDSEIIRRYLLNDSNGR